MIAAAASKEREVRLLANKVVVLHSSRPLPHAVGSVFRLRQAAWRPVQLRKEAVVRCRERQAFARCSEAQQRHTDGRVLLESPHQRAAVPSFGLPIDAHKRNAAATGTTTASTTSSSSTTAGSARGNASTTAATTPASAPAASTTS